MTVFRAAETVVDVSTAGDRAPETVIGVSIRFGATGMDMGRDAGSCYWPSSGETSGDARGERYTMGTLSIGHMLVVAIVALLLFGAGRVAELGKGMGEGIRAFKKGIRDDGEEPTAATERAIQLNTNGAAVSRAELPKKKVIQIEVDEGADEAELVRALARQRSANKEESAS